MASNMTRYQPQTNGVTRLPDLVNQLFEQSFVLPSLVDRGTFGGTSRPSFPVNLWETGEGYTFQVALPGMKPEDFDIQVMGREVSIHGKYEVQGPENGNWIWRGITGGEFHESFTLPVDVQGESVQATYDYGILTLTLPKADHVRPKSIKIQTTK